MSEGLPIVYVARHGETAWSITGQHTSRTDLPLTPQGEANARQLGKRLRAFAFAKVFTSPLQRAARTCEIAGYGSVAEVDADLVEWDYGAYEGRRSSEIRAERPNWDLFRDGCPGGESPAQIALRADRVVLRIRGVAGNVLVFSSGHFIRMLASRWIGTMDGLDAKRFTLGTASLSALGYERNIDRPVVHLWNETTHAIA